MDHRNSEFHLIPSFILENGLKIQTIYLKNLKCDILSQNSSSFCQNLLYLKMFMQLAKQFQADIFMSRFAPRVPLKKCKLLSLECLSHGYARPTPSPPPRVDHDSRPTVPPRPNARPTHSGNDILVIKTTFVTRFAANSINYLDQHV